MRRFGLTHATAIAYAALFVALGGSGYAAAQVGGARAHAAAGSGVKVRCSAKRGGKKVSCKVVAGSGVGPRGPQGPRGASGTAGTAGTTGSSGASGPTSLTTSPAFSYLGTAPGSPSLDETGGGISANDESQQFTVYTFGPIPTTPGGTPGEPVFRTYLESPGELDGGTGHLQSIEFCYGLQDTSNTFHLGDPTTIAITQATLTQYDESGAGAAGGQPPTYDPTPLFSMPLDIQTSPTLQTSGPGAGSGVGTGGCQTLTPSTAPVISPTGYLALDITATFTAPTADNGAATWNAIISFGRITTTYSP
jgi:hypothetical protein